MEPRPPRPRSQGPLDHGAHAPGGAPPAGATAPGGRPYPGYPGRQAGRAAGQQIDRYGEAGAPPGYGPVQAGPPYAAEIPLVPRQERRRRRVARGAAALLVLVVAVGGLGLLFRDRLFGGDADGRAVPAGVSSPPAVAAVGATAPAPSAPTATRRAGVANLLATATPTPAPPTPTVASAEPTRPPARPTRVPTEAAGGAARADVPLTELLPTEDEVPGLQLDAEGERTVDDVVSALGGTDEAAQLLTEWGWERNVYRDFVAPADAAPGGLSFLNVSVHRFASPEAAAAAVTYFSDYVIAIQGLEEVPVDPVGDQVRALQGAPEGLPLAVLYVRDGADMYRIGGTSSSPEGDPIADVVAVAERLVAKA